MRTRITITALLAALAAAAYATVAMAAGGVSFADNYWSPDTIAPGDTTAYNFTIAQDSPMPNMTVTINTHSGDLTFVGNGDPSAVCSTTGTKTTCTYTDAAHGYKSDHYVYTSDPAAPDEAITANISATIAGGGHASKSATVTIQKPVVVPPPTGGTGGTPPPVVTPPVIIEPVVPAYVPPTSMVFLCLPGDAGNPEVFMATQVDDLDGYWNPYAVKGAQAISDNAGGYRLTCAIPAGMHDTGTTVDVNGQQVANIYRQDVGEFTVVG